MNINNYAQKTNYTAGSSDLEIMQLYLTTVNIPGITLSHPELGGRSGAKLNVTGDTLTFNVLSFEMIVDEDFKVYHELMQKINDNINPESGSFASTEFDFWVEINNSKGNFLFKMEFYNCRIESIGDIQLDSQDDITEYTMSMDIKYDYYKIIEAGTVPSLRT